MMGRESILLCAFILGPALVSAFLFVMFISVPTLYATDSAIIGQTVRLTEFMPGTDSAIVHAEMVVAVDRNVKMAIAGDAVDMDLNEYNGANIIKQDGVKTITYDGPLVLNGPASAGDEIELVIRHGAGETAVAAIVKG